jgi:hypothetical protein
MKKLVGISLLAGFLINLCDVSITVAFVADPWNAALAVQGIAPNPFTPLYYVSASFLAGALLVWLYRQLAVARGPSPSTALLSSLLL